MSVFKVQLNNTQQGRLDFDPSTGGLFTTSKQRSVYVMGPNKINRTLFDGQTFTDCNYWKRFAYPQVPLDQAIVTVLSDDGSVYTDDGTGNSFPYTWTKTPAVSTSAFSGTGYTANNVVDIFTDTGSYAQFVQITNSGSVALKVKLNGSTNSVFDLPAAGVQVFDKGDLLVAKVEFANASGSTAGAVQVVATIRSACNS